MKELYIYSLIFDLTAELFIRALEEAKALSQAVAVRLYTAGGDPMAAWGMIQKLNEHTHGVQLKVDGKADSAGAYFLLFQDDVEALETSQFLFHRAFFPNNPIPVGADLERLTNLNKDLRAAMEKKLDIPAFEEIAGVTLEEFFTGEIVIDVNLNAKNAKKIGLIKKITTLADEDLRALGKNIAAYSGKEPQPEPKKEIDMDLNELKTKHPTLYSQIVAIGNAEALATGKEEGIKTEKDRIEGWMVYIGVDPVAVAKGIESGENLTQKAMGEFAIKSVKDETLAAIAANNADETETEENLEVETAIAAYTEALKGDDKELIAKAKSELAAVSGKKADPKAENLESFEKELKEKLKIK